MHTLSKLTLPLLVAAGATLCIAQAQSQSTSQTSQASGGMIAQRVETSAPGATAADADLDDWVGPPEPGDVGVPDIAPPEDPGGMDPGMGPGLDRDWRGPGGHGDRRGFGDRGPGGEMMLSRLVNNPEIREKLGITADQAAKIRQQSLTFETAQIRNRADVQVRRAELRSLLEADNPDRAAIDRKLQEVSTAELAATKSAVNFRLDMRNALTPEQKQKLQQWRKEMWEKRSQERGHRRGPDGPGGPGRRMRQGPPPPTSDQPAPPAPPTQQ